MPEGRAPVVRFRMPEGSLTWNDLVRGDITFETQFVPDFALCRANGDPLYTLVNPVDDALMEITHVLRGEDLLSSTPRQVALYEALKEVGIAKATPEFGHLPYVMGEGNKKLSKRDPEAHAGDHLELSPTVEDDDVGRLPQPARAFVRGYGDPHGKVEAGERPECVQVGGVVACVERAPQAGWGQALQSYLDPAAWQVRNHAQSGRSARRSGSASSIATSAAFTAAPAPRATRSVPAWCRTKAPAASGGRAACA